MFHKPYTKELGESFKAEIAAFSDSFGRYIKAKKKQYGENYVEAAEIVSLLLAHNIPGVPGYINGDELPGTDILSLKNSDSLMAKHFPFATKQGLKDRFVRRNETMFLYGAFTKRKELDYVILFTEYDDDRIIKQAEQKLKIILEWIRIVKGIALGYEIILVQTGKTIASSSGTVSLYTREIFVFSLFNDFFPLSSYYILSGELLESYKNKHHSWNYVIEREKNLFPMSLCNILEKLPTLGKAVFFKSFTETAKISSQPEIMNALIYLYMAEREHKEPFYIYKKMLSYVNRPSETLNIPVVFYDDFKSSFPETELYDEAFYLTIRKEKHLSKETLTTLFSKFELDFMEKFYTLPSIFPSSQYKELIKKETTIINTILSYSKNLESSKLKEAFIFSKKTKAVFNLDLTKTSGILYPVNFSQMEYTESQITFRSGIDLGWELSIIDEKSEEIFIARKRSLCELLTFATINGISKTRGFSLKNVGRVLASKTTRLWEMIESWFKSDEQIFMAINYVQSENHKDETNTSITDIYDTKSKKENIIKEISLIGKTKYQSILYMSCFKSSTPVSETVWGLISSGINFSGKHRISVFYETWQEPVSSKMEKILEQHPKAPFIMKENESIAVIEKEKFNIFNSIGETLRYLSENSINTPNIELSSEETVVLSKINEFRKNSKHTFFITTFKEREVILFHKEKFAASVRIGNDIDTEIYLASLISFINSISVMQESRIDFSIIMLSKDGSFRNISQIIESKASGTPSNLVELYPGYKKNVLDNKKAKGIGENITELAKNYLQNGGMKYPVTMCNSYPLEIYTETDVLALKLDIDNALLNMEEAK